MRIGKNDFASVVPHTDKLLNTFRTLFTLYLEILNRDIKLDGVV